MVVPGASWGSWQAVTPIGEAKIQDSMARDAYGNYVWCESDHLNGSIGRMFHERQHAANSFPVLPGAVLPRL